MHWQNLINPGRLGSEGTTSKAIDSTRSAFQRDYDRIIFSSPFRRLQNKTQVFPLPGSIFVHNRLTHSLEVASVGRSLGNNLIKIILQKEPKTPLELIIELPTIVASSCLAHDLGNPPFGHSGEETIQNYFTDNRDKYQSLLHDNEWNDLIKYEGNANAFRLLTHQYYGKRAGGFQLSYTVLASMVKYPYTSNYRGKKFGFFQDDVETFRLIAKTLKLKCVDSKHDVYSRHPLVYLVEAADDICYQVMDIEDAHKLGILTHGLVIDLYRNFFDRKTDKKILSKIDKTMKEVTDLNEQVSYLRALVISKLVEECSSIFNHNYDKITDGDFVPSLVDQLEMPARDSMTVIKEVAFEQVYNHRSVIEIELGGNKIISSLLNTFCQAVLHPGQKQSKKIIRLMPKQYHTSSENNYQRIMSVLDFVSGMTDLYALDLYKVLNGIEIPGN